MALVDSVQPPTFQLLRGDASWRPTWTHIVPGKFSPSLYSGLLFYDRGNRFAAFYETDGQGGINLLKEHNGWRDSWTLVVPGIFGNSGFSGLLLYDQQAGFGAFYDTDGHGNIIKLAEDGTWRTTWTHIIAGNFTDSKTSGLLFYDQSAGFGAIYSTNGHGGITLLEEYDDWRTTWTHIVPGQFSHEGSLDDPALTDLFFYEGSTRYGEVYASTGDGRIDFVGSQNQLPQATTITSGSFGGSGWTNLLFYDRQAGRGTFLDFNDLSKTWSPIEAHDEWRRTWDLIVGGNFWMAHEDDRFFEEGGFTDLLFYESSDGYGEFYLHEPLNPNLVEPFAGYVSSGSVRPGDTIEFHVSSRVGPYTIAIFRQAIDEVLMTRISNLNPAASPLPIARLAYRDGAQWPTVGHLKIPDDWPTGLYLARVEASRLPPVGPILPSATTVGTYRRHIAIYPPVPPLDIPFVVRAADPVMQARILFAVQDTTYEAYNFWGGRSLYGYSYGGQGAHTWAYPQTVLKVPYAFRVSFRRPHTGSAEKSKKWQFWEVPFIRWLERQGIRVDVCAISDLHKESDILANYRLFVCAGHSEYWSKEMRDNVERFVENGGNVAFFGGNISWWQVRFEDDGNTMVCYKNKHFDPNNRHAVTRKTVTVNWFDAPLKRPETSLTGVSYYGTPIYPGVPSLQYYVVRDANHWAFNHTGFLDGAVFGDYANGTQTVIGTETDKKQNNDSMRSPDNFHTLATVSLRDEKNGTTNEDAGTMGIFRKGKGTVFTASTMNWVLGLSQDCSWSPVDLITRNVLIRLG